MFQKLYSSNEFGGIARDKGIRLHIVRDDTAGSTVCFGAFDGLLKVSRLAHKYQYYLFHVILI